MPLTSPYVPYEHPVLMTLWAALAVASAIYMAAVVLAVSGTVLFMLRPEPLTRALAGRGSGPAPRKPGGASTGNAPGGTSVRGVSSLRVSGGLLPDFEAQGFSSAQDRRKRHPAAAACWAAKPAPRPAGPVVGRKSVDGWLSAEAWHRG